MAKPTGLVENNYLNELYKDLYIKSAVDIQATIDIISWIEELSSGANNVEQNHVFGETPSLPGKPAKELVAEFERFWNTSTNRPSLNNLWEMRNSLYRFQSL